MQEQDVRFSMAPLDFAFFANLIVVYQLLYSNASSREAVRRRNWHATPFFINITYTKKRPSIRQNHWCAKGRMVPCLGVLIRQYCRRFIPPSLYSLLFKSIGAFLPGMVTIMFWSELQTFKEWLESKSRPSPCSWLPWRPSPIKGFLSWLGALCWHKPSHCHSWKLPRHQVVVRWYLLKYDQN